MHCIIHQHALCAKSANLVDVMSVVVKVVNSILSRSLNHRQFQALVDEVEMQHSDLLYFCEVRWLSRGAMLSRVCDLQKEIATFLRQKNLRYADQFFDRRWFSRLALLTDITTHLNALDVKLQDKGFPRLAACVSDDVEQDTCDVASPREEFASRFAGVRPLQTSSCLPPPLTFPRTTPLPPADGVGGATVQ